MVEVERITEHPFFAGLAQEHSRVIADCAKEVRFEAGQYLFHEGEPADQFFLLRQGRVALEITVPGRGPLPILTIHPGQIAGVSWLAPPYRMTFDAKAIELTRALAIDARCLRQKSEENPRLGYELAKRFMTMLAQRLLATRLQILDVYGAHP